MNQPLTLDCRGLRLAACRLRQGRRKVLALHGWLDNAASFGPLAPLLDDCEVVAVDLPGHGLSEHRPAAACYLYVEWVDDVVAILAALGWSRCTLLGHSMGGGIASLVAALHPDQVTALLMLDGLGWVATDQDDLATSYAAHRRRAALLGRAPRPQPPAALVDALCRVVPGLDQAAAHLLVQRGSMPCPGGFTWRYDQRLRLPPLFGPSQAQVVGLLQKVVCPAWLLRPRQGFNFSGARWQAQRAAIRGLQQDDLDGAHHLHMQQPQQVAEVINAFVRTVAD